MSGYLMKPSEWSGASPDRWITLAFQAGSRDEVNGDMRMTRRCLAHVTFLIFLFVHTLYTVKTGQHLLITCGKQESEEELERAVKRERAREER